MGMKYIYMSSHMPLHMAELQIKQNEVQHFKNVFFWQSGMHKSISQAVQLMENKGLFIEVLINAAFVRHH